MENFKQAFLTSMNNQDKKENGENMQTQTRESAPPKAFTMESVISSKRFSPQKVVVYGVPGVGKTTFAGTWPNPVLLRAEDGAGALDIPTFPNLAQSMDDLRMAILALLNGNHGFQTLILDSLDWIEPFVWQAVCAEDGKNSIEDFGYGKGYVKVDAKWQGIQTALDMLRQRKNMHIVAIAHAVPQIFDPPDSEPWMRYGIKLHKRAASLWTEWAEMLLFINYQTRLEKQGEGKAKAKGSGDRVIFTQERPAWLAKSRWPLPESIYIGRDANFTEFHKALKEATNGEYQHA